MSYLACIDIGTITARLALAEVRDGHIVRLVKKSTICNLGEGVDGSGEITPEAAVRTLECVRNYVQEIKKSGAVAVCCSLTSAARDAKNADELGYALHTMGLDPVIIPGELEAALTHLGVSGDFVGKQVLVVDNGGGSTELASGRLGAVDATDVANAIDDVAVAGSEAANYRLDAVCSVDVGARRIKDRFFPYSQPPDAGDLVAARSYVRGLIDQACTMHAPHFFARDAAEAGGKALNDASVCPELLVCCGGTATSLVAIRDSVVPYDPSRVHLRRLSAEDLAAAEGRFSRLNTEALEQIPGLQKARAELILPGTLILRELLGATGFLELCVSEADLLFGLILCVDGVISGRTSLLPWIPAVTSTENLLQ